MPIGLYDIYNCFLYAVLSCYILLLLFIRNVRNSASIGLFVKNTVKFILLRDMLTFVTY